MVRLILEINKHKRTMVLWGWILVTTTKIMAQDPLVLNGPITFSPNQVIITHDFGISLASFEEKVADYAARIE